MAFLALSVVALVALSGLPVQGEWSQYHQRATFSCHNNQILRGVKSVHYNDYEDRIFNFTCGPLPSHVEAILTDCQWSDWVNNPDQPVFFECPNEKVMNGFDSIYNRPTQDRRYKFMCCQPGDLIKHNCTTTAWQNDYDDPFDFHVSKSQVLNGVISKHYNVDEDRVFRFNVCDLDHFFKEVDGNDEGGDSGVDSGKDDEDDALVG